jgi:hypothetical protein
MIHRFVGTATEIKNFKERLTPKPKPPTPLFKCIDNCGALIKKDKTRCKPCKGERLMGRDRSYK